MFICCLLYCNRPLAKIFILYYLKRNENNNKTIEQAVSCTHDYIESRIFASSKQEKFSQIFRVLVTLFGKMASLSYNKMYHYIVNRTNMK